MGRGGGGGRRKRAGRKPRDPGEGDTGGVCSGRGRAGVLSSRGAAFRRAQGGVEGRERREREPRAHRDPEELVGAQAGTQPPSRTYCRHQATATAASSAVVANATPAFGVTGRAPPPRPAPPGPSPPPCPAPPGLSPPSGPAPDAGVDAGAQASPFASSSFVFSLLSRALSLAEEMRCQPLSRLPLRALSVRWSRVSRLLKGVH